MTGSTEIETRISANAFTRYPLSEITLSWQLPSPETVRSPRSRAESHLSASLQREETAHTLGRPRGEAATVEVCVLGPERTAKGQSCSENRPPRASRSRSCSACRPNKASISHRISGASRPSSAVFFNLLPRWRRRTQLQIAEPFGHCNQLLDQPAEAMILLELLPGLLDRGTRRDDVRDGFAANRMGQRVRRTVSLRTFLGALDLRCQI